VGVLGGLKPRPTCGEANRAPALPRMGRAVPVGGRRRDQRQAARRPTNPPQASGFPANLCRGKASARFRGKRRILLPPAARHPPLGTGLAGSSQRVPNGATDGPPAAALNPRSNGAHPMAACRRDGPFPVSLYRGRQRLRLPCPAVRRGTGSSCALAWPLAPSEAIVRTSVVRRAAT
jgi:hypothetical protein